MVRAVLQDGPEEIPGFLQLYCQSHSGDLQRMRPVQQALPHGSIDHETLSGSRSQVKSEIPGAQAHRQTLYRLRGLCGEMPHSVPNPGASTGNIRPTGHCPGVGKRLLASPGKIKAVSVGSKNLFGIGPTETHPAAFS